MEFLRSFLRRHLAVRPVVESPNVGCFLRLVSKPLKIERYWLSSLAIFLWGSLWLNVSTWADSKRERLPFRSIDYWCLTTSRQNDFLCVHYKKCSSYAPAFESNREIKIFRLCTLSLHIWWLCHLYRRLPSSKCNTIQETIWNKYVATSRANGRMISILF